MAGGQVRASAGLSKAAARRERKKWGGLVGGCLERCCFLLRCFLEVLFVSISWYVFGMMFLYLKNVVFQSLGCFLSMSLCGVY